MLKKLTLMVGLIFLIGTKSYAYSKMTSLSFHMKQVEKAIKSKNLPDACYRLGMLTTLQFVLKFEYLKDKQVSPANKRSLSSPHFMRWSASGPATAGPCYGSDKGLPEEERLQQFKENFKQYKASYQKTLAEDPQEE